MANSFILQQSLEDNEHEFIFTKKQWIFQPDSNSGNYSTNQVIFDLSNIANSGQYINFLQSYVHIPLVYSVQFKSNVNTANLLAVTNAYKNNLMGSLKNGSFQLIHSMNVKLGNNEVVSIVPYQNLKINYQILTTYSKEDVDKCGPSMHFAKETGDTASFSATQGSVNTKVQGANASRSVLYSKAVPDTIVGMAGNQINTGRLERMLRTNVAFDDPQISGFNSSANASVHGKDYCEIVNTTVAGAGVGGVHVMNFYINATIRLADLHDYFAQCPLSKNGYYQLVFNLNTNAIISYNVSDASVVSGYAISNATPTIPFQVSPLIASINQTANAGSVTACLSVCNATNVSAIPNPNAKTAVSSCRLYTCLMTFSPDSELKYLSNPVRKIKFMETFVQSGGTLLSVGAGNPIQVPLSGQFARLRKLVIFPFISATSNGTIGVSPLQSVFASEPATCSPYSYVENLNITVSGEYLYSQNQNLTYEQYAELLTDGGINGSLGRGVNSGLLSQQDFENSYGFIVCNLSNHLESDDNIMKQLVVSFTNKSINTMDYIFMLFYEKEIVLNISTGNLIL